MHTHIANGTLPLHQAEAVQLSMDPETPFRTKLEFVTALAALTSLYWPEVKRKTARHGQTLAYVISCAATAERIEWYWNGIRYRHRVDRAYLPLLGSGTSPNETLHHELNVWFRHYVQVFHQTLELQLRINEIGKLFAHNRALYTPALRGSSHKQLLHALSATWHFPRSAWDRMCGTLISDDGGRIEKASLPCKESRMKTVATVRAFKPVPRRIAFKRPAAQCVVPKRAKAVKRHAFKLKRARD